VEGYAHPLICARVNDPPTFDWRMP
jgi:hypothetical protein